MLLSSDAFCLRTFTYACAQYSSMNEFTCPGTPYIYVRKKNASLENSLKATIFSRTNFSERFRVCDKAFKSTSSLLTEVSTRKKRSRVTSASMEEYKDCFLSNLRQNVLFLFNFKKHPKPKYVLCFAFGKNGEVISGDSNGNIFIWEEF